MIVIGIDAHMRSHTAAAVDAGTGRQLGELTVQADEDGHRGCCAFAERFEARARVGDRGLPQPLAAPGARAAATPASA